MLCFVVQTRVVLLNWCAWFLRMRRPGEERIRLACHNKPPRRGSVSSVELSVSQGALQPSNMLYIGFRGMEGGPLRISPRFTRHPLRTNHGLRRGRRAAARGDHALARGRGRDRGAGQWWHCGRGFGIGTGSNSGGGAIHR